MNGFRQPIQPMQQRPHPKPKKEKRNKSECQFLLRMMNYGYTKRFINTPAPVAG